MRYNERAPVTLMPSLALSFDRLHVATPTDAPKRKAVGHYGVNVDSSLPVALVALSSTTVASRLLRTREVDVLEPSSRSPAGAAMLTALRDVVLRVALATGVANAAQFKAAMALSCTNNTSMLCYTLHVLLHSHTAPARWPSAAPIHTSCVTALTHCSGAREGAPSVTPCARLLSTTGLPPAWQRTSRGAAASPHNCQRMRRRPSARGAALGRSCFLRVRSPVSSLVWHSPRRRPQSVRAAAPPRCCPRLQWFVGAA